MRLSCHSQLGKRGCSLRCGLIVAIILSIWAPRADAESKPRALDPEPEFPVDARLRGFYVALGPVGLALHSESNWDSAFGGELNLTRVNERSRLVAWGLSAGAVAVSERDGGRVWVGGLIGMERLIPNVPLGLSAGALIEVDSVRHNRYGAFASLWFYAGVMPFVRVSSVQKSGLGVEIGLSIPLPAIRL